MLYFRVYVYDQNHSHSHIINVTQTQVHHNVFASKTITPPESILPDRLVSILKDPDTFVIFAGGSFSFRKGHDLIIDAMSSLVKIKSSKRIVLVTAWVNLLAETRPNLRDQIRRVFPGLESTHPDDMSEWLSETKGIPTQNHYALGLSSHTEIATVLQHADAALFTNRAEGGTNLPAMEAMASGLAVILSANTGHLDLIRLGDEEKDLNGKPDTVEKWWTKSTMKSPDHCVALQKQSQVKVVHHWQVGANESQDWGESDVNEIVSAVRDLIENPNRAKELGRNAAKKMSRFTWTRTALRIHRVRSVRARSARISIVSQSHVITRISLRSLICTTRKLLKHQRLNAYSNVTKTQLALEPRYSQRSWVWNLLTCVSNRRI